MPVSIVTSMYSEIYISKQQSPEELHTIIPKQARPNQIVMIDFYLDSGFAGITVYR